MQYAVNIADLTVWYKDLGIRLMLLPVLEPNPRLAVDAEPGRIDGHAAVLATEEERAAAIVDILRNGLGQRPGYPKHTLRMYQRKPNRKRWTRI